MALQPHEYIIGLAVFALFVVGSLFMLQDMITNYDLNVTTDEYEGVYNILNETYNISMDVKDATIDADIEGTDQTWDSMIKGGYKSLRFITGSFAMVGAIISAVAKHIGIPNFVIVTALIVIMTTVIFSIIYMIFRYAPQR